ncbi:MAG: hypothetical protein HYZ27_12660 [Deltaproteobacteria bacterium]|nr:hypothetical protein [Deltaproteobacteria bacterium]
MRQLGLWQAIPLRAAAAAVVSEWTPPLLADWLSARLGRQVRLVFTHNRSTMLSFREDDEVLAVRLHRKFAGAGQAEAEAPARYLAGGDRTASRVLDAFVARATADLPSASVVVAPRGRFHHLGAVLAELNERYFHGQCRARITWGAAGPRRWRRSIQLGCYVASQRLIRIHPSLDQAFVPRPYVAWIVFHEMLHEVLGVEHGRRRCLHPPEFAALEASYPDHAAAKAWEQQNLHRLLVYRPRRRRAP